MNRQGLLLVVLTVLTVLLVGSWLWQWPVAGSPEVARRGAALWRGEQPLVGHVAGHTGALPSAVSRCINCHAGAPDLPADARAAPQLTPSHLREAVSRRGGPPSRFDKAGFCTLLRTGVDPAAVLLPRHMPRYEIGDADCAALWHYLVSPGVSAEASP